MTTEVMIDTTKNYSIEEYLRLPDDGKRYELVKGELVEMAGPSGRHGIIIFSLGGILKTFLDKNPYGVGLSGTAFVIDAINHIARVPDLAFVTTARAAGVNYDEAFPKPPDLAIEVMSPTDKWSQVVDKVNEYQQAGVPLVWVIDPFDKGVFVYELHKSRKALNREDELDGGEILPGFKLEVSKLFE